MGATGGYRLAQGSGCQPCPDQSARGLAQSKTLARGFVRPVKEERLEARRTAHTDE